MYIVLLNDLLCLNVFPILCSNGKQFYTLQVYIANTKPGGLRKLLESVTKVRVTAEDIASMLTEVLQALKTSFVEPNLISQIFKQVCILYDNLTIDEHIENQLFGRRHF